MSSHASPLYQTPRTLAEAESMIASIRADLCARGLSMRAPPEVPDSCCGRGCSGCVWEGYYAALLLWRDDAAHLLGGAD